jgi:AIG2-like family
MDPELMLERCPHSPLAGTGWVNGWRLTFAGARSVATIVPDHLDSVFVALYELSPHDRDELDRWEAADTGLADSIRLRVLTLDGDVVAWAYVSTDYEGGLPTQRYLDRLAEAAAQAGAPEDYVQRLRARPCR